MKQLREIFGLTVVALLFLGFSWCAYLTLNGQQIGWYDMLRGPTVRVGCLAVLLLAIVSAFFPNKEPE